MTIPLHDSLRTILDEVRQVTGKNVEFIQKTDLPSFAMAKLARRSMPRHLVLYTTDREPFINYMFAHECGHILRMFRVPEEKRLIPMWNEQMIEIARREFMDELPELVQLLGKDKFIHVTHNWHNELIRKVTNLASDLMIERWLYDDFQDLRNEQRQAYDWWAKDAEEGLSSENLKMVPHKAWESTNTMDYVFFKLLDKHIQSTYLTAYQGTEFAEKGNLLADLTERTYQNDYEGDIRMVNEWAKFLGLTEWFGWTGFEDVREDYHAQ